MGENQDQVRERVLWRLPQKCESGMNVRSCLLREGEFPVVVKYHNTVLKFVCIQDSLPHIKELRQI